MTEPIAPPQLEAPPVVGPASYAPQGFQEAQPEPPTKPQTALQRIWAGIVAFFAAAVKFGYPVFKLLKGAKFLLTLITMFASMWFYARIYGWQFGIGFVICILIHEMGHVFAAWRLKQPVSVPIFIPGMGALITLREGNLSAFEQAIIGIGGPAFGALSGIGCLGLAFYTHNPLFVGLALMAFFLNLFNMIPLYPLDGGRITGAVSPYIWVVGIVLMVAGIFTLHITNPMIYLIILFSLPSIISGFKRGTIDPPGKVTTTPQKVIMGLSYVLLTAFLFCGMVFSAMITSATRDSERAAGQPALNRTSDQASLRIFV